MKNLSIDETIEILRKVFISSGSVKDEDLELFMENSIKIDSEIIYRLLLTLEKDMDEKDIHRIFKFLPEKHKSYFEIFLPLGSLLNKEKARLYEVYKNTEKQLDRRKCSMR